MPWFIGLFEYKGTMRPMVILDETYEDAERQFEALRKTARLHRQLEDNENPFSVAHGVAEQQNASKFVSDIVRKAGGDPGNGEGS